ncbi:MAG TPA: uracil-DNA glycosylase [Candidatus Binataceae bacterium]|nr:uracil-DNA glycosylase [Candidatus Binataceae bacterium]
MSDSTAPPDRSVILATLRDYVEQIREEGMEGLPAGAQAGALPPRSDRPASVEPATGASPPRSSAPPIAPSAQGALPQPAELFSRYPGLEKTGSLEQLSEFIGDCRRCKLWPLRTNLVFGVGNPKAELMFIGEAPGADEDARGEPFVGRAGQLLTDIIERGMGMARREVYICNVIKCRPPENRNPEPDEVAACEPFMIRQIELVRPRIIVGLGTFAVQALLKVKTPIGRLRGVWQDVRGIPMMPTFHPAYLLRNPNDKRLVWADVQQVLKALGRPLPRRGAT